MSESRDRRMEIWLRVLWVSLLIHVIGRVFMTLGPIASQLNLAPFVGPLWRLCAPFALVAAFALVRIGAGFPGAPRPTIDRYLRRFLVAAAFLNHWYTVAARDLANDDTAGFPPYLVAIRWMSAFQTIALLALAWSIDGDRRMRRVAAWALVFLSAALAVSQGWVMSLELSLRPIWQAMAMSLIYWALRPGLDLVIAIVVAIYALHWRGRTDLVNEGTNPFEAEGDPDS